MFEWGVRETLSHLPPELIIKEMVPVFKEADFRMINLETPVLTDEISNKIIFPNKSYIFKSKPEDINLLKLLSIDLAFLGNNHTMDYGMEGLFSTIHLLNERGIGYVGAGVNQNQAYTPFKVTISGIEFNIISANEYGLPESFASEKKPGIAKINFREISQIPSKEKNQYSGKKENYIASLHWGMEYSPEPELYQRNFAHNLVDSGYIAVIGHHPHIYQGIEKYKNGIIFYSLGNFIFGSKNHLLSHNLLAMLHFEEDKLKMAEIIPVFGKFQESESFYIYPLEGEEADSFLKELYIQCNKLNTELEIKNGRGYINF